MVNRRRRHCASPTTGGLRNLSFSPSQGQQRLAMLLPVWLSHTCEQKQKKGIRARVRDEKQQSVTMVKSTTRSERTECSRSNECDIGGVIQARSLAALPHSASFVENVERMAHRASYYEQPTHQTKAQREPCSYHRTSITARLGTDGSEKKNAAATRSPRQNTWVLWVRGEFRPAPPGPKKIIT